MASWEQVADAWALRLFRQPGFSQGLSEFGNVFRSAKRDPIREIGNAERWIELPQACHCLLRLLQPPTECIACGRDP